MRSLALLSLASCLGVLAGCAREPGQTPAEATTSASDTLIMAPPADAASPAPATGATTTGPQYRATGNEPGWRLDLGERFTLVTQNGTLTIDVPAPVAELDSTVRRYRVPTESGSVVVTIHERLCTDTMTGMPFPDSVDIQAGAEKLQGCGGDPASLLQGKEWVVEDLNGGGIIDSSHGTLNFGADGRLTGHAFCNRYMGTYSLTGEGLAISQAAATRMACAPSLMGQEAKFLAVLQGVQRFEIGATGQLILRTAEGGSITARR